MIPLTNTLFAPDHRT